jgi:hypothetical protein
MASRKGVSGYNNLVPETSSFFKNKAPPKKPIKERQFAYELKVHLKDKSDCEAFAKCVQRPLSRTEKAFTYSPNAVYPRSQWKFTEKPRKPRNVSKKKKDKQRFKNWFFNHHWVGMPSFKNEKIPPYMTFTVRFSTKKAFMAFALKTDQSISTETKSIWYPERENDDFTSKFWISTLKDKNPRYPVYIVSKGRAGSRLTSRSLEKMKVPYFIAVEPQDYDEYSVFIDPKKILTLPFSNHGDGPGPARNWCWDHSISLGAKRHWCLDDNINDFYRLHENKRIRVADGAIFRAAEDFVDRYENVPVAGFQYRFFISPNAEKPPFVKNTRIYSCLLIDNNCRHRWRGRYNEDSILSLDVLSDGDCTIQFNSFLQGKAATQTLKGGNTDEFYAPEGQEERAEGTRKKSEMLKAIYPDITEVVYRYGRWHHLVDYRPFQKNRLKPKVDLSDLKGANEYGMKLIKKSF